MRKDEVSRSDETLPGLFGQNRFDDGAARDRLPESVYRELCEVQSGQRELSLSCADVVAAAMKDWAMERGATHYTHWFQPLTGRTAEKHDSFLRPGSDGKPILEFSGKELIKGESDASSFPSGGLRATFEARGYTAWDVTSPAFIKEDASGVTLYVPTAFVSYRGEALDGKVPLLRSMEAISSATSRLLKALGVDEGGRVVVNVGPEQEYFLVDASVHARRPDLSLTRRTLFGCAAPKGQELEDHYYGQIPERVLAFMSELNRELWRCGVPARTQHKEVAPAQFEIACTYQQANLAADSNQLVMESLHKVASRHGFVALLHEKPFARVNGSGKHVNWSVQAGSRNLLDPDSAGEAFLPFLAAVIEAVDLRASLLRASAASAGNDLRLGANEAPPAIVSVFLGDGLERALDAFARGEAQAEGGARRLLIGMTKLPALHADSTDRNRTSPFAFTGNKFEFRMVPSGDSISLPVTVLNSAVADTLNRYAERLEAAPEGAEARAEAARALVAESWKSHKRVVFNGNGYSREWREEAARRGLPNLPTTVDALEASLTEDAIAMYERVGVLSRLELESRQTVAYELYAKRVLIEAATLAECARRGALPAAIAWLGARSRDIEAMRANGLQCKDAAERADAAARQADFAGLRERALEDARRAAAELEGDRERARACRDKVVPAMEALREALDELERAMPPEAWPYPGYAEILFGASGIPGSEGIRR
jgi:glutamine synthetase